MQEIFEKLRSLQVVLSQKYQVQDEIRDIPKTLETKMELLNRGKKNYLDKNERLEKTREELVSLRIRLDEAERVRENYEKQMDMITTQREYEALDKEIKDAAEREQQFRKSILHKEKVLDDLMVQLEEHEDLMKLQEDEVKAEQEKMESVLSDKNKELESLIMEEKSLVPDIDQEVLYKFERIIRSKEGVGIVPIHGIVCTGCHMSLPTQFVNDVRRGNDFKFCPYCSRILYFEEVDGLTVEDTMPDFESTDDGSLADLVDLNDFDI